MDGMILYYENKSNNLVLNEEISFNMNNCYIEGKIGDYIEIFVEPGKTNTIMIIKEQGAMTFDCKISKMDYQVTPL